MNQYDSTQETLAHIRRVQSLLSEVQSNLAARLIAHDTSKLEEPEKPGFDKVTGALRGLTYGSQEYKDQLKELAPILSHHYAVNSHHPEHFKLWKCPICKCVFNESETREAVVYESKPRFCPKCCPQGSLFEATLEPLISVDGMSLLDVVEMLCDWKAATERHADGSITKSIQINKARFNISDQLASILENTRKEMGWEVAP